MAIEVHEYTAEQVLALRALFSRSIEEDEWVLYHSTSSAAEDNIDRDGLRVSCGEDDDLFRVIKVFRAMNWCGESHAGYPVLRGFSLHRRSNAGVYFRESSTRSLIYAHPDFAGGETIRALHYAILDLQAYVDDPLLRQKHYDSQVASCRKLVEQNGCPTHVIRVDTEWVRARLIELDTVIKC